uniref:(S)-2-hydroxy-acid oxidase n=1 Tax=Steinernema glaseri TaxID=37863 RepID=A0A1I7Y4I5_9BILA
MLSSLICVDDIEKKALALMSKPTRDYYQIGSDTEATLRRNLSAFKHLLIRPRCLRNVSQIHIGQSFSIGDVKYEIPCPVGIAPSAFHRLAHDEGEIATVKAASRAKTIMILSSLSTVSMEDVAKASENAHLWFQLYIYRDRNLNRRLVERAYRSGYKAIVLTIDAPPFGRRRELGRHPFKLPPHLEMANFRTEEFQITRIPRSSTGVKQFADNLFDESISWDDLKWLVETSPLPVVVKGVLRGDDALQAVESGAAGIIVSNHGGRQLDFAPSTVEVLPEVVRAVAGRVPVFLDGGVRTGNDIFKALALGVDMVFVGRPALWGLVVGGSDGVARVLDILQMELEYALKLSGHTSIEEIRKSKDLVVSKEYFMSKL